MDITRTLVVMMLIGSVVAGFAQMFSTRTVSGVITSYSTVASTSYGCWTFYSTTTQFRLSTVRTITTMTQDKEDEPYFRIRWYWKEEYGGVKARYRVEIVNLMKMPILEGAILWQVVDGAIWGDPPIGEYITLQFESIEAGASCILEGNVPLKRRYLGSACFFFIDAKITCWDVGEVQVPTATYTSTATTTRTHITTYTATLMVSEPLDFLGPPSGILLLIIVAGTVMVMIVLQRRRVRVPVKIEMAAESAMKLCIKCCYQLPADADFCSECGRKQT